MKPDHGLDGHPTDPARWPTTGGRIYPDAKLGDPLPPRWDFARLVTTFAIVLGIEWAAVACLFPRYSPFVPASLVGDFVAVCIALLVAWVFEVDR